MEFINKLNNALEQWFLLKHPFYQAWNEGKLSKDTLTTYAQEYYHHVAAFPRYISQIHTNCEDIASRQILLGNLIDEEQGENNHPELWLRFLEGISAYRMHHKVPTLKSTVNLVDGFFAITQKNYASGLGALYAYERQTPEVAASKIDGLKKHYGINDARTLEFFEVHQQADEWHTAELIGLMKNLSNLEQQHAFEGAIHGAKLLWRFLDEMHTKNDTCCQ